GTSQRLWPPLPPSKELAATSFPLSTRATLPSRAAVSMAKIRIGFLPCFSHGPAPGLQKLRMGGIGGPAEEQAAGPAFRPHLDLQPPRGKPVRGLPPPLHHHGGARSRILQAQVLHLPGIVQAVQVRVDKGPVPLPVPVVMIQGKGGAR